MKGFKNKSACIILGIATSFLLVGCGDGFQAKKPETQDVTIFADEAGADSIRGADSLPDNSAPGSSQAPPEANGQPFNFNPLTGIGMNLAEVQTVTGQVRSLNGFSGTVNLSIDRTALSAIDPDENVKVSITPSSVNLSAGGTANYTVRVEAESMAPSFDLSSVQIIASDPAAPSSDINISLNIKVNAVVVLKMLGGDDPLQRWDRPTGPLNFRDHPNGMRVLFVNYNPDSTHIVHGNGAIPHGPRNIPMAAAPAAGQPGGVYEVNIEQGTVDDGTYYFHDLGADGDRRTMNFGVSTQSSALTLSATQRTPAEVAKATGSKPPEKTGPCH